MNNIPTTTAPVEWLHYICFLKKCEDANRKKDTPHPTVAIKNEHYNCKGLGCDKNINNYPLPGFQFDHRDPRTKFASIGFLCNVIDEVLPSDL